MNNILPIEQTLSSLEVAEMMKMAHKNILRKIEGRDEKGKHIDGALDIISRAQLEPSDYFIKSFYVNSRGKEYPAYNCTRKGCEFLAHKFQGAKGIEFTIAYIERFHQMEEALIHGESIEANQLLEVPTRSRTRVPLKKNRGWFYENREDIEEVRKLLDLSYSELYHMILSNVGEYYDLKAAREIYKRERGHEPKRPMDIIDYFPELNARATYELGFLYEFATS